MRVFIMGGTGSIGSAVVRELVARGHEVIGLARSPRSAAALESLGASVLSGDIRIPEPWLERLPEVDGVIHAAADFANDMGDVDTRLKELCSDERMLRQIRSSSDGNDPGHAITAQLGPLASGAAVVANGPTFNSLVDNNRGLLGIDMEAYGIATAAQGNGKPRPHAVTIKAVCDFADEVKNDDYQEYAASASALFFYEAIKRLPLS